MKSSRRPRSLRQYQQYVNAHSSCALVPDFRCEPIKVHCNLIWNAGTDLVLQSISKLPWC